MSELPPLPKGYTLDGDQEDVTPPLPAGFTLDAAPESSLGGMAKAAGVGVGQGIINAAGFMGDAATLLGDARDKYIANPLSRALGLSEVDLSGPNPAAAVGSESIKKGVESVTGEFYKPQTTAESYIHSAAEFAGNPLSYVGPGSLALKAGGAALAGLGSEAGGQAAKGSDYEGAARFAGGLAGGIAGVKAFGPKAAKAAIPNYEELKASAKADYTAGLKSGYELHPQGPGTFAATAEQELASLGHTGGQHGTAPGIFSVLDDLQNIPPGATVTAANLDAIRKNLALRARATNEGKPTPDAHAASVVLDRFNKYVENPDPRHILAGDAAEYVRATKQGNANYAASQRVRTIDLKRTRAENNAEGGIATSIDNQLKSQMRTILNNPSAQRGFSGDELAAIGKVNKGTLASNTLRQAGRLGAGVIPLLTHVGLATSTGGASIPLQIAAGAGLYGARKGAEAMTVNQAKKVAEMLAKRSPEYQARVIGLPSTSTLPNKAQMIRVLMGSL